jgi:UDP-3-O-[3-hydroxymyristoyl] glucosamine N-acyltransferase
MAHTLMTICRHLDLPYEGEDRVIRSIQTLAEAGPEELSFFHNAKYLKDLPKTRAAAVLVEEQYVDQVPEGTIPLVTDEPYLKLALATELFVHPLSTEGTPPELGEGCDIDPTVRFGRDVVVGAGTRIMAGSYIGDGCVIGEGVLIHPNVTIYHGSRIGDRCILHAGCVVGSDGYGFAHTRDGRHVKVHQLGGVILEEEVEVGANTTIDRGALGPTIVRRGTKIDNLVQIGHNCEIGENCLIVAQNGLAGSTKLGRNVVLGGQSATAGHLEIGDFATFAARSVITKSLPGHQVYGGAPAIEIRLWKRMQAALLRLTRKK